jgi:hypothetical protein
MKLQLITYCGMRRDCTLSNMDLMTLLIRTVPYPQLTETDREHVKALLDRQHTQREQDRFAPIYQTEAAHE